MTKLQKLLLTSALGAFIAFPSLAQVTSDTTNITAQVGITAKADGTSNLGSEAGQSATAASEAFVGNPVMSSDGAMLGTVTTAASKEDGSTVLLVDLAQESALPGDNFEVMLAPGQASTGEVVLIWPKAEILAALTTQIEADVGSAVNQ